MAASEEITDLWSSIKSSKRMNWDEYFSSLAQLTANRSPCSKLHVGCVLVKDNHVISMGYNGFLPNAPHTSRIRDGHELGTVHAEQNAICDAARRGVVVQNSIAYITHYPCIHCFKILAAAGISKIKYIDDYKNDELVHLISQEINLEILKLT